MTLDLAIADKVKQLRRVGLIPPEHLIHQILRAGAAATGPLLALATNIELLHQDEPGCYGPLHALRLLGELRPVEMIPALFEHFPALPLYQDEEPLRTWNGEVPQMIGRIGKPALEPLWSIFTDPQQPLKWHSAALDALLYMTVTLPELRERLVAELRAQLASSQDKRQAGQLVIGLSSLGVREAYAEIMALYRQGRIDQGMFPAAEARQFLLDGKAEQRLECIKHSLDERYALHGPFPEEEQLG